MYAQIPCNYDHYDYNTYDVKNVHCVLQEGMRDSTLKAQPFE
jgi:hypothetical protein